MGLFDKLKAAKNFVTGGGAEVQVQTVGATLDGPFELKVRARAKDGELAIKRVYAKVRAVERVEVRNVSSESGRRTVSDSTTTAKFEIDLADATTLTPEGASWSAEIELPQGALPTYHGRNARHVWEVCAFLDKAGNDPDSGWKEFEVH